MTKTSFWILAIGGVAYRKEGEGVKKIPVFLLEKIYGYRCHPAPLPPVLTKNIRKVVFVPFPRILKWLHKGPLL